MRPPDEVHLTKLLFPGDRSIQSEWLLWEQDIENSQPLQIRLLLRFGEREVTQTAETYWDAFRAIRRELEQNDILVYCDGGSRNVYPSPMSLDMGTGELAYRLTLGESAKTANLVNIFTSGPDLTPATVDEQDAFYKQWIESIVRRSKP